MIPVKINNRWTIKLPEHRQSMDWDNWEKPRLAAMHDQIKYGDILFDIGAEEMDMSGLFASWGATVIPFEPNPLVWPNGRAIWEANKIPGPNGVRGKLYEYWVGFASDKTIEVPERMESIINPRGGLSGGWPECAYGPVIGNHGFRNLKERSHDTPQIKIDDFIELHSRVQIRSYPNKEILVPDILNIDVEGAELRVLRGAEQTLLHHKPKVFVSVHEEFMQNDYGEGHRELDEYMLSVGYRGEHIHTDHESHQYWCAV